MTPAQIAVNGEGNRVHEAAPPPDARLDVFSERGMGGARVEYPAEQWPSAITLRLHLAGLEALRFGFGSYTIAVSVSSSNGRIVTESLSRAGEAGASLLDEDSPFWMAVTRTPRPGSLAALRFDVAAPAALFAAGAQPLKFDWLDFYR